jgi:N-acetylglucosaminyldiphosphoundecaprenol N-acetyl-beta-D-mannosaminyltransferase
MATAERIEFLNLGFDALTLEELVACVKARPGDAPFDYVVTPNVDHVVQLHRQPDILSEIYRDAAFTVCDSRILATLAKAAGLELTTVPGSDFTARFLAEAIQPEDAVLIVGGTAEQADRLRSLYGFRHLAHYAAPMNLAHDPHARSEVAGFVIAHPARYIFFAVGSPQQELIAHEVWKSGKALGTGFCIGASIDFLTGKTKRAPRLIRRLKLEWLHRLIREPRRMWRRYLVDDIKIFRIYRRWRRQRRL